MKLNNVVDSVILRNNGVKTAKEFMRLTTIVIICAELNEGDCIVIYDGFYYALIRSNENLPKDYSTSVCSIIRDVESYMVV